MKNNTNISDFVQSAVFFSDYPTTLILSAILIRSSWPRYGWCYHYNEGKKSGFFCISFWGLRPAFKRHTWWILVVSTPSTPSGLSYLPLVSAAIGQITFASSNALLIYI